MPAAACPVGCQKQLEGGGVPAAACPVGCQKQHESGSVKAAADGGMFLAMHIGAREVLHHV